MVHWRLPIPAFYETLKQSADKQRIVLGAVAEYAFVAKFSEFERGEAKIMKHIRSIWRSILQSRNRILEIAVEMIFGWSPF